MYMIQVNELFLSNSVRVNRYGQELKGRFKLERNRMFANVYNQMDEVESIMRMLLSSGYNPSLVKLGNE